MYETNHCVVLIYAVHLLCIIFYYLVLFCIICIILCSWFAEIEDDLQKLPYQYYTALKGLSL